MLSTLIQKINNRLSAITHYIALSEACDDANRDESSILHGELKSLDLFPAQTSEERVFRHCSVISRLYSVYEEFAENIVGLWLARLPQHSHFTDLPVAFREVYRQGISQIIKDLSKRRYRHLNLTTVVKSYLVCLEGVDNWEIVSEAFTNHEANLRRNELEKLFSTVGMTGLWDWLESDPDLINAKDNIDQDKTLEMLIEEFVEYRNHASHGSPDQILSLNQLRRWVELFLWFFRRICVDVRPVRGVAGTLLATVKRAGGIKSGVLAA